MHCLELFIRDTVRRHGRILSTTLFDSIDTVYFRLIDPLASNESSLLIYKQTIDKLSQGGQIRRSGLFLVWSGA